MAFRLRIRKQPPKSVQSEDLQERVCSSDTDEHAALVHDLRNLIREMSALASCLKEHSSFGGNMNSILTRLWVNDEGQDIAEYAVMLAVILVIVVGTMRIVGSNSKNAFSTVASSLQ
jgi:Flp pilus assembly pilin Flp